MIKINTSALINKLKNISNTFENKVSEVLNELAESAKISAQTTRLFKGVIGSGLRAAIKIIPNSLLSKTVLADKNYAYYVEYGNNQKGPYIYPVRAKALHFFINNREIFAKRVRTYSGKHFMLEARTVAVRNIPTVINKHLI